MVDIDCIEIDRNRWHTRFAYRFILIFTDFNDLYRKIHLFIQKWKLNSCKQQIYWQFWKLQLRVEGSNIYHCIVYQTFITFKAITLNTTLRDRRAHLCQFYIDRLWNENHPLHFMLPKQEEVVHNYNLRSGISRSTRPTCRTKRTQEFVTHKYT